MTRQQKQHVPIPKNSLFRGERRRVCRVGRKSLEHPVTFQRVRVVGSQSPRDENLFKLKQRLDMFRVLQIVAIVASLDAANAVYRDNVSIELSMIPASQTLLPNFVGFSIEVPSTPIMLGQFPGPPRKSFANLMTFLQRLNGPGAPGPVVRPGGSSADNSVWAPSEEECRRRPANVTYCINATDLMSYAQAVPLWNGKITLDVSFRSPNVTLSSSVAHAG